MKFRWKSMILAGVVAFSVAAFAGCGDKGGTTDETNSYGYLCIEDLTVYINANSNYTFAEINPVFTKPEKAEEITYTYDTSYLNIENNIVTPLKRADKTINVRASGEHFSTVFKVDVEYIKYTGSGASPLYDVSKYPVSVRAQTCSAVNEDTTLFIGDSFMDDGFIGDYMKTYATGKEVLNAGMSSTTSYHWEASYSEIIGETAPKNIVLHIGTNNFYDASDAVEDTQESLKRLFMFMHNSYPSTNIYWFNITQRADSGINVSKVTQTNAYMANWCAKYDWITCVDTCSKVTPAMLKDGTHPKTEYYAVYTDALADAGCLIVNK